MSELNQALLAAVPADGSSIGNQSLLERLRGQFPQLTEEAFWEVREALIEQGVLRKGRGRGGSVLRAQAAGGGSLADQALNKARERFEPAQVAKVSAEYVLEAAKAVRQAKSAKVQPATGIEDLKKTLWATADKLRANMDAAEYKHIVLGLIFLKYISDSFAGRRAELERKLLDENDDYYLGEDDPEALAAELEDRDYYREVNVFWVPEVARWESIRASAKQVDIGKRIDDALAAIEAENPKLKNILDKRYARAQLPDGKLGELVDLISTIGFGDDAGKAATCSARSMNTSSASSPVPRARRAGSSIPRPASSKPWWRCSTRTMARSTTPAAAVAACSCSRKNSSKPTAASWAMYPSTARNPTPPLGGWRR